MDEHLGAVIWGIGLFIVPAVALLVAAILIGTRRRRDGQPRPTVNRWIIAEAVIVAGPVAACCAIGIASWREGSGVLGVLAAGGIALLLLAGLYLGFVYAPAAGWAQVVLAFLLPMLARVTESGWVIDANTGTLTPESVGLGILALIVLYSLPALFSGILLIVSGQPGKPAVDTTTTQADRKTSAVGPAPDTEPKAASPHQTPV